jgi:hypothetical protein
MRGNCSQRSEFNRQLRRELHSNAAWRHIVHALQLVNLVNQFRGVIYQPVDAPAQDNLNND